MINYFFNTESKKTFFSGYWQGLYISLYSDRMQDVIDCIFVLYMFSLEAI